jgi:phosphotransacetylase
VSMPEGLTSFDALYRRLENMKPLPIAVAAAEDETLLKALGVAVQRHWVQPLLVGQKEKLELLLDRLNLSLIDFTVITSPEGQAAGKAVQLVRSGEAELLMKGRTATAELLRAVLNKESGLVRPSEKSPDHAHGQESQSRLLSHVAVVESPNYPHLMLCTDGGVNIDQPLPVLRDILSNSLELARALGIEIPRVAVLALVENVSEKLPETRLAQALAEEAQAGRFGKCHVEGPLALDVALSREAARSKGIDSEIAGKTNIFLGTHITTTNFVVKALMSIGGARGGGVILGATAPIVLLSRSDLLETRLNSIAISLAMALRKRQHPAFSDLRQFKLGL